MENVTAKEYATKYVISVGKARKILSAYPSRLSVEIMAEHSVNHRRLTGLRKTVRVYTIPTTQPV